MTEREQFLETIIKTMHHQIVEQCSDIMFTEEQWKTISSVSGIAHPYECDPVPFIPDDLNLMLVARDKRQEFIENHEPDWFPNIGDDEYGTGFHEVMWNNRNIINDYT